MRIYRLTKRDAKHVAGLDELAFGHDYDIPPISEKEASRLLGRGFILGMKERGKLVSNIQVVKKGRREWYIHGIATLPEKQGIGLAGKLLKRVLQMGKSEDIKRITATVRPDNAKSIGLLQKNRFRKMKFLRGHYGKGKDRILLEHRN